MGRHARGATRSKVSVATVILGMIVVAIVVGSWLSSLAQSGPIVKTVEASAVVVSSLACTEGGGGTIVDVLRPAGLPAGGSVRAGLDACGLQEGQQLVVQYPSGDPSRVSLVGTDSAADSVTGGRMLPIGLAVAALLALGAGFAVWIDSRRSRRSRGRGIRRPAHEVVGDNSRHRLPDADSEVAPVGVSESRLSLAGDVVEAEVADNGRHGPLSVIQVVLASMVTKRGLGAWSPDHAVAGRERDPEAGLSSVDLALPFTAGLAASLRDELFTHRSVSS